MTIPRNLSILADYAGTVNRPVMSVPNLGETITVSATVASGTPINYDCITQSQVYYTSNASANWTVNFRGSSTVSMNEFMTAGQSITVAFLVTQGTTAYYNSVVQVDSVSITPKWQNKAVPSSGVVSSIEAYVYNIIKTGNAAFTIFASKTTFSA